MVVKHTYKRIFCTIDLELKNSHTFTDNTTISLKRQFDNFDRRYTMPVNGVVLSADNIPTGAHILLHHNAGHPTYELPDYIGLDGEYLSGSKRYFSVPESECYAWRLGDGEWNPCPGFEFGLRIFIPYAGGLDGIPPKQIKNKLLITSGELCGKAVITKSHCDYEIIFQDINGREGRLIRLRHFKEQEHIREEIVAIDYDVTEKVNNGEYIAGTSPTTAKQINVLV